jgi:alpha-N-arabinofuranosidase
MAVPPCCSSIAASRRTLAGQARVTSAADASAALAGGMLIIELPPASWTAAALS